MEWNGMEWNGMEWNGMEWKIHLLLLCSEILFDTREVIVLMAVIINEYVPVCIPE
jgi:hypothetical protein